MWEEHEIQDLVTYVANTNGLDSMRAKRVVNDVLSFLGETPEAFVRRRHTALQRLGHVNKEIFPLIASELISRRFAAPAYSARQLRRIVYG